MDVMDKETRPGLDLQERMDRLKHLLRHVWAHFQEDRCMAEAASLSYTSLLSLVPLLAVAFGILAIFPVFDDWSEKLQSFIFDNFMPSTGEQIVPYLNTFLDSVSNLTLPGVLALVVTALLLLIRIEVAFNRIWRVDKSRTLLNRVVIYWAVMTLVPIMIIAAMAISAQKVMGMIGGDATMSPGLYRIGIFVVTWLVFASVFVLVPHRRVQVRYALSGAFLSAVLFGVAKAGFVAYVSNANYKVIYGALATVPIFLFWLYLVWIVVLFGASLAASLTTFSDDSRYETRWPERWVFQVAFRLVGHFRKAQKQGEALSWQQILDHEPQASEDQLLRLIGKLAEERIIIADDEGNWLLARDLEDLDLSDLHRAGEYYLPLTDTGDLPRESEWDDVFVEALIQLRQSGEAVWKRPLRQLYLESKTSGYHDHE
jgi:membrane protein